MKNIIKNQNNNKIYLLLGVIFIFCNIISNVNSTECVDSAIIWKADFSLNDNTFSHNYDGTSGIIEKIYFDESSSKYELWQSTNIDYRTTYPFGGTMTNYEYYTGDLNPFTISSNFNSLKNRMLIINNGTDSFELYVNLTLKNTGTCHYNNHAWVASYGNTSIKYTGMNDYYKTYYTDITPSGTWEFKDTPQDGLSSMVYKINASNLKNYGKLYIRIGPEDTRLSNPEYQRVNAYFWIDGPPAICGNLILDANEQCEDGNTLNDDGCSSTCQNEVCNNKVRVESATFSLNDNTFSQNYDGTSGIIEEIYYNDATNQYNLWQTSNLAYNTSTLGASGYNAYTFNAPIIPFTRDIWWTWFYPTKVLVLNNNNPLIKNFDLYYNLTLKNVGNCNNASVYVGNYGTSSFKYAGGNSESYTYSITATPSSTGSFNFTLKNQTKSIIYNLKGNNIPYFGKLYIRLGPRALEGYPYNAIQEFNAYFWFAGDPFTCGNGIKEGGEGCDDGNLLNGDGCSSICLFEPTTNPIIKWENYLTADDLWQGRNLTSGENFILKYNVTNPNTYDMDIQFKSLLYTEPYSYNSGVDWTKRYWNYDTMGKFAEQQNDYIYIHVPALTTVKFNRTFTVPYYTQNQKEVLERFYVFEAFRLKKSTEGSYYWPKTTLGQDDYSWWRNSAPESLNNAYWGSGWYTRGQGLGAYTTQYAIAGLAPNNAKLSLTVNNEGVPEIETYYENGIVRSSYINNISPNTFYLKSRLLFNNGIEINSYNKSITQTFKRNDGLEIQPFQEYRYGYSTILPELKVNEKISFPLYDFDLVNNQYVKIEAVPYLNKTNKPIYMYNTNINTTDTIKIDLETPVVLSVDSPIIIRPNGAKSYDELYQRFLLFNYKNYSLFNVEFNITFLDNSGNEKLGYYTAEYTGSNIIPAGSAYPIGVKIKYIGPTGGADITNDQIKFSFTYYDSESETDVTLYKKAELKVIKSNTNEKFIDLIPVGLNFTMLNLGNESEVAVDIANQGSENSGSFDVDFYVKGVSESTFTHIGTKNIASLNKFSKTSLAFNFTPIFSEKYILKVVVDKNDDINESNIYSINSESNNVLTSIAMVRDIDVVLVYVIPLYENASNGIIPFKVFAENKGVGGIDFYELKMTLNWGIYTHTESFFFYQIPEEGIEKIFYWNVTNVPAHPYITKFDLFALFDPDMSDNHLDGAVSYCPLPWYSTVFDCFEYCDNTCLDQQRNRYDSSCRGINGCSFYNQTFAVSCNGYLKDSYAIFNDTHQALCPAAEIIRPSVFTNEDLIITHNENCSAILIEKFPKMYQGESVLMDVVYCVKDSE